MRSIDSEVYLMDDDEIKERILKYKCVLGAPEYDVFCMSTIFSLAGIASSTGRHILSGRENLGKKRRYRLSRALIMAETGMIVKKNGRIAIGNPTHTMPARLKIRLTSDGIKIEKGVSPRNNIEVMPSFSNVFVDNKMRLPVRKES